MRNDKEWEAGYGPAERNNSHELTQIVKVRGESGRKNWLGRTKIRDGSEELQQAKTEKYKTPWFVIQSQEANSPPELNVLQRIDPMKRSTGVNHSLKDETHLTSFVICLMSQL